MCPKPKRGPHVGVEKNGRAEDEREKTTDYHVVAVLVAVLDVRLNPNLRSIIQPARNYERRCCISARKSKIQDVGKAPFFCFFFLVFCFFAR